MHSYRVLQWFPFVCKPIKKYVALQAQYSVESMASVNYDQLIQGDGVHSNQKSANQSDAIEVREV